MPPATHSFRFARSVVLFSFLTLAIAFESGWTAPTPGMIDHFPGPSVGNWLSGGSSLSNPGTGGVLGAGDGFLIISTLPGPSILGTVNTSDYLGNWTAAGITAVRFWLNDVGTDEPLEMHFAIGKAAGGSGNFWQYNTGFIPPLHAWSQFTVDLTSASSFTQIINTPGGTYAAALADVDRIVIRHDLAPYEHHPDVIAADVGLDELLLDNSTTGVGLPSAGARRPIQLAAPYPNPSSGPMAFAIESFDAEPIRLEIVDVTGRMIRHATLAASAAGSRIWTWDGLGDAGERVSAGYYRVRAFGPSGGTSRPFVRL